MMKMDDQKPESDNDSDIIIIDDGEETITIKDKFRKPKTKKPWKRKVKLGKAPNNNMETLLITQRLNIKRTEFIRVININGVDNKGQRCPDSIIRFARNECKKEAYYNRIVPSCNRHHCFPNDLLSWRRCRAVRDREFGIKRTDLRSPIKTSRVLSPISSISLTDSFTVSYEDVSDKSFSSEDELDTLIKRTKEREKQLVEPLNSYPAPASTLIPPSEDVASTYSGESLHSISTLVLQPLETEVYSPTMSLDVSNISGIYSPTLTPDWIKMENMVDYKTIASPYSPTDPTETPNFSETEIHEDYKPVKDGRAGPYSDASPPWNKIGIDENKHVSPIGNIKKEQNVPIEIIENNNYVIKTENIKPEKECESEVYYNKNEQDLEIKVNKNNRPLKTEKFEHDNDCDVNDNF